MNDNKAMKEEHEFDSWRYSSSQDQYQQVPYYPTTVFPYQDSLPSSQPWSNGPEPPMTFLGGYEAPTQQHSGHYTMEAMFGSQNTYGFGNMGSTVSPFNAFFPSNSDPFWGGNSKPGNRASQGITPYRMHETPDSYNYHHSDSYQMSDQLKHVDTGIAGLTLDHIKASDQFSSKSGPFGGSEAKKFDSLGSVGQMQVPKKMTWASIASQPAKPQPKSLKSKMSSSVLTGSTSKHLPPTSMETIGTWEAKNGSSASAAVKTPPASLAAPLQQQQSQQQRNNSSLPIAVQQQQQQWTARQQLPQQRDQQKSSAESVSAVVLPAHPVLDKLRVENNYNPKEFDLSAKSARFFIIKSYSEDDIHRSIKYSIWCSTEHGNKRLDTAFKHQHEKGPIYLLFSVNGSGHFCGMAQMMSFVDYNSSSTVWAQDKWKGQFRVKWIYVKDVPNAQLRHIRLENNENKPVTNSRDTQEVPFEKGKQVIKIMHHYRHTTSIFDDFLHYEKRQEEESQRRVDPLPPSQAQQQQQQQQQPLPPPPPQQQQQQSGKPSARQWKNQ